jgi:thiol-disulfide isomerase/thioredoxin
MFFTTGCKDCRQTLPHIQRIYDEFLPKGVRFALISREDGPESVAAYWAENGFDMPYSAQTDRKMYNLFAKDRVPRVFVNHQGVIRFSHSDRPNPTYDLLKSDLESLLNN